MPPTLNVSFLGLRRRKQVPRSWSFWRWLGSGRGEFTFWPLQGSPTFTGCSAVDGLRWSAKLGAGVSLGLGRWLSSGSTATVVLGASDGVQGLRSHSESAGAGVWESVLWSRHRHEPHAEMLARVAGVLASPYFSPYAVRKTRDHLWGKKKKPGNIWKHRHHQPFYQNFQRWRFSLVKKYTILQGVDA